MKEKTVYSKVLALGGTILVWLPILFMLFTGLVGSIQSKRLLCDYMLPAELFPVVLAGAGGFVWAALRERVFIKPTAWTTGSALFLLFGCQGLAVIGGLANGRVQVEDAPGLTAIVTAMLIGYDLCVILLGYWGIRLCKRVFIRSYPLS